MMLRTIVASVLLISLLTACTLSTDPIFRGPVIQLPHTAAAGGPLELVIDDLDSYLHWELRCTAAGSAEAIGVELATETNHGTRSSASIQRHTCRNVGDNVVSKRVISLSSVKPTETVTISFRVTANGAGTHVVRVYRMGNHGKFHMAGADG